MRTDHVLAFAIGVAVGYLALPMLLGLLSGQTGKKA